MQGFPTSYPLQFVHSFFFFFFFSIQHVKQLILTFILCILSCKKRRLMQNRRHAVLNVYNYDLLWCQEEVEKPTWRHLASSRIKRTKVNYTTFRAAAGPQNPNSASECKPVTGTQGVQWSVSLQDKTPHNFKGSILKPVWGYCVSTNVQMWLVHF